jgi:prepilin-type N-terminal cleavage/methylation domain-containing protein
MKQSDNQDTTRLACNRRRAFTLVELLVVIAIIGVLTSMLLPALCSTKARALQIQCAANLSSLGRAFAIYSSDNESFYPAAFSYRGMSIGHGVETPNQPTQGYVHWSAGVEPRNLPAACGRIAKIRLC